VNIVALSGRESTVELRVRLVERLSGLTLYVVVVIGPLEEVKLVPLLRGFSYRDKGTT